VNKFEPKKTKFRKQQVGVIRGLSTSGNRLSVGDYGIRAITSGNLKVNHLESARIAARKATKRIGKILFPICCDTIVSRRPLETRMGKGKSSPAFKVAKIKPGRVIMEFMGVPREVAFDAFKRASHKLPIATTFIEEEKVV
jgi:large subunit ribosomal protein L16